MSVEAFSSSEAQRNHQEKIRAVEAASEAIAKLRTLIAEVESRLGLEHAAEAVDTAMVEHLKKRLQELTAQLEDAFAFLEEFDPILYQRLKDNS